jgi:guanylate kinase
VTPLLLVLSSPSGGGKTTIARRLLDGRADVGYSVSATTRAPRAGEVAGRDYHFLSRPEFERRVGAGDFLEHAAYGGNLYGTLRSEIERIFAAGRHAVLDIEVEGARQVRRNLPDGVYVFVLPPSGAELVRRLEGRNTEDAAAVRRRLEHAAQELAAVGEYDYAIVNDDLARAVIQVSAILDAETKRVARQNGLSELVAGLRREIERAKSR